VQLSFSFVIHTYDFWVHVLFTVMPKFLFFRQVMKIDWHELILPLLFRLYFCRFCMPSFKIYDWSL